ncbi:hypothetical protein [Flavobacterium sp.]|uniref:hypothetical protein n=1 Tax=Flavobacterium sp. TaxID=239 RepID=UPI001200389C|nr:hypothetical protein [Flavobacterium sp.]RZJ68979.1 MAG: hypothetical protein EOO49_18945 [Flavobacterium sp.]
MQKVIFKFTAVVASTIASLTSGPKIECPKLLLPEIRVEKIKPIESPELPKTLSKTKTALS